MADSPNVAPLLFRNDESSNAWIGPVTLFESPLHGRGLAAKRDISAGECLFIMNPTVSADIEQVKNIWQDETSLEESAEQVLLNEMKKCSLEQHQSSTTTTRAASFLMLVNSDGMRIMEDEIERDDAIYVLLGSDSEKVDPSAYAAPDPLPDDETLVGIIRHNAFGPDFHNYSTMDTIWRQNNSNNIHNTAPYYRILGLYPLAAMLNHSCSSNAVGVFCGETMIVHANANIKRDEEICWSYIPPIEPYHARQSQLQRRYGFDCRCTRCSVESEMHSSVTDLQQRLDLIGFERHQISQLVAHDVQDQIFILEEILKDTRISNEAKRYLRVSYLHLYIGYFNAVLSMRPINTTHETVLSLATQLHFSLATCHNASTEHLSILHLCYEMAGILYGRMPDQVNKIRFWTDQLKRAHMVRYGSLGNNLENVREVMKHTQGVLRNQDGLLSSRFKFV